MESAPTPEGGFPQSYPTRNFAPPRFSRRSPNGTAVFLMQGVTQCRFPLAIQGHRGALPKCAVIQPNNLSGASATTGPRRTDSGKNPVGFFCETSPRNMKAPSRAEIVPMQSTQTPDNSNPAFSGIF